MNKIVIFLYIVLSQSCQYQISEKDLEGTWTLHSRCINPSILQITFQNNEVQIQQGEIAYDGKYKIQDHELYIQRNHDSCKIQTSIKSINRDSLIIFDSLVYIKNSYLSIEYTEEFALIGIKTKTRLSEIKLRKDRLNRQYFHPISFFHDKNGILKLKIGEKTIVPKWNENDFSEISNYFTSSHSNPIALIFIDKNILLKELKHLYLNLSGISTRFYLITNQIKSSDFHVFIDRSHLWQKEIDIFYKKMAYPPYPPTLSIHSREKFLSNPNSELVQINSIRDTSQFKSLNTKNYLISINSSLNVKEYIQILQNLINHRSNYKFDFRIEI